MPLTGAQLRHLERRLHEERDRAVGILERTRGEWADADERERAGDLTSYPFHAADRGTDTNNDEVAASNLTRVSHQVAEIDAALSRLAEAPDDFGRCAATGREIPFERLDVVPWARTCM